MVLAAHLSRLRSALPHTPYRPPPGQVLRGFVEWVLILCQGCGIALTLGHFPEAEAGSFVVDGGPLSVKQQVTPVHRFESVCCNASRCCLSELKFTAEADMLFGIPLAQLSEYGALEQGWKVFVVMVVGGAGRRSIHSILDGLQTTHPEAAIIGGFATGSWLVRAYAHRLQFVSSGVVGLMFRGNVPLTALVCKGEDVTSRLNSAKQALVGEQVTGRWLVENWKMTVVVASL